MVLTRKILLISLLALNYGVSYSNTKTIAVLDFKDILTSEGLGKATSEILRTKLAEYKSLKVLERAAISQILEEYELQQSGIVDEEKVIEIGKLLCAELVVVGSVVATGNINTLNIRIIFVQTGLTKNAKSITFKNENELPQITTMLAEIIYKGEAFQIDTNSRNVTDTKNMALIKSGTFRMGSYKGDDDEEPVHKVKLDAYYIDIYEVSY